MGKAKRKGRLRGKQRRFSGVTKKRNCTQSEIATQLITIVVCKQNYNRLWTCTQKTTRAQKTTTSHQPMLISTHPGFLSLAFIHSVSLKHTNINLDTHTHTLAHAPHAHKPIFHPKIHEGKSLSSSTSHSFPSTLRGTVPSSVPALPLKSPYISGKQFPVTAHSASFLFSGLVTVRWRLFFVSSFEIICVN